jgi:outer membrane protein OmpA-like peptidoglycan-associated protein
MKICTTTLTAPRLRLASIVASLGLLAAACAPTPTVPEGALQARTELTRLQSDAQLAPLAPEAIQEAEAAVQLAEQVDDVEPEVVAHRVYLAQRKVETARATAEARRAEQQRTALAAELDQARLQAREREAQSARMDAQAARMEADSARMAASAAQQQAAQLQQEIDAMHAQTTNRGLVLTLGDVLFETGKADLKSGAIGDLDRLAAFLAKYPDRTVTIEGHTDSVGSEDYNLGLSERRAESVRSYLMRAGVSPDRIRTQGMGESVPVASNDSAGGRQQNRRVEIIVSNPPAAAM